MSRRLYLPWTFIYPVAALVALGTFVIAEQLIAKWTYQRAIEQLIAAKQPVDEASLRAWSFN